MSKIYERFIHNSLSSNAETILSNFTLAYRKSFSLNHVLLRLIENRKNPWTIKILWLLLLWISPRLLTVFLMIYLLHNFMHMVYQRMQYFLCTGYKNKLHWKCFSNTLIRDTTRFYVRSHFIQYLHKWLIFVC